MKICAQSVGHGVPGRVSGREEHHRLNKCHTSHQKAADQAFAVHHTDTDNQSVQPCTQALGCLLRQSIINLSQRRNCRDCSSPDRTMCGRSLSSGSGRPSASLMRSSCAPRLSSSCFGGPATADVLSHAFLQGKTDAGTESVHV